MYVYYNGMTGDNQLFLLSFEGKDAANIHCLVKYEQINLRHGKFKVNFVTPDSIGLTYVGRTTL